jgi:peroxiredoxin
MPTLDRLGQRMHGKAFAIVGINAGEEVEDVLGYRMTTGHAPAFPLFLDRNGEALKAFGVKGLPTTFILDREGRIVYKALGGRNFEDPMLVDKIRALVEAR